MLDFIPVKLKAIVEVLNWGVILATLTKVLPPLAAAVSITWYGVQFYDRYKRNKKKGS